MTWNDQIFSYCERGANPAFWAEPINALTNAAFFIAAIAATVLWLRQPPSDRRVVDALLIGLVFVIGTGSFLFHTTATRWAALADSGPIAVFMIGYLAYGLRRLIGLSWAATFFWTVSFVLTLAAFGALRCNGTACLNGSVGYLPAFGALALVGGILWGRGHPAGATCLAGAVLFAISLTFRTLDYALCPWTLIAASRPTGTHFVWHILNAVLLYALLRAAILYGGIRLSAVGVASRA